jgi:hypothetical protein
MRNRILSTEPEFGIEDYPEPEYYCHRCGEDLSDEDEETYSEWSAVDTGLPILMHNEDCLEPPPMSFFRTCECCASEFDLADQVFVIGENKLWYCSARCKIKHERVCLMNVEEPDIVY